RAMIARSVISALGFLASATLSGGVGAWTTNGPTGFVSYGGLIVDSRIPGTLYAGTSTGLAKSTDDGATWSSLAVASALPATPLAAANGTVYASVGGCDLLLSCTSTVYKSADGGQHWQTLLQESTFGVLLSLGITIDPTYDSTLYLTSTRSDP